MHLGYRDPPAVVDPDDAEQPEDLLRNADLVSARRDGVSVYYRISDATVFAICRTVCDSMLDQASSEAAAIAEAAVE